ncbi:TetR/AcrR family transcriptional regulator [Ideonella oryzae]|uniref:TetR/AcrR family transcriptional regulator n=1 Tax=Ideonella oryzae TaxID=2937441 RepID=A0ABT1BJH5_9BURK|nr:TetR/AcrR family transcriptional regulator [Ideonella oryzae]MCO5976368.1 TetR/AcrR family transcriptional regulator [Ideonella oryzae]
MRAQIVEASMALFHQGGERAVSMRALARQLGISTMALYTYFPTKAHLMHHIWADMLRLACAQGELAGAESPCDWSRLDACLQGFLSYWMDHPDHLREILAAWQAETDGRGYPPWFGAQRVQLDLLLRPLSGQAGQEEALLDVCRDQVLSQILGTQMLLLARANESRAAQQGLIECATQAALASLRHRLGCQAAIAG